MRASTSRHFKHTRTRGRDRNIDRGPARCVDRRQNVLEGIDDGFRRSHADLHPAKSIGLECLKNRRYAPMPARASAQSVANRPYRHVEIVVHENASIGLE